MGAPQARSRPGRQRLRPAAGPVALSPERPARWQPLRLVAAGLVALLAVPVVGAGPASADPLPVDRCTTTSGVVLAVDFGHWGGPLLRSCGSTPTTGYELLNQGGWRTTGTGHDGPAFICRIGYSGHQGGRQYPPPEEEACVLTPPASAYWSYWHADAGADTWTYSQLGAMSYRPRPGSVDLWIFGGTDIGGTVGRPAFSPDTVRAHNRTPTGTTSRPTAPRPGGGGDTGPDSPAGQADGGTGTDGTTGRPDQGTNDFPAPPAGTVSTPPFTGPTPDAALDGSVPPSNAASLGVPSPGTASGGAAGPRVVDAAPVAPHRTGGGSVLPVVAGVALVGLLAAGGAYTARRRRPHRLTPGRDAA
ncbi:hypothetical protein [Plantactinospora sonchi]|uniref:LPXTG cell wall anchor domain-containing protein n=1 Tax=Plantactinospora sonchi TaxID=1544735 RepID=A0ABU7RZ48_9ACTN